MPLLNGCLHPNAHHLHSCVPTTPNSVFPNTSSGTPFAIISSSQRPDCCQLDYDYTTAFSFLCPFHSTHCGVDKRITLLCARNRIPQIGSAQTTRHVQKPLILAAKEGTGFCVEHVYVFLLENRFVIIILFIIIIIIIISVNFTYVLVFPTPTVNMHDGVMCDS